MFRRLADFLVRHRWPVLAALAALTAVAVALMPRIRFDFTPQAVLAGDDDLVTFAESVKADFGYDDASMLVVLEATSGKDVLDRAALQWQVEIAGDLAPLPHVVKVVSIGGLELAGLDGPCASWRGLWRLATGMRNEPLIARLPVTERDEARVRDALARTELIRGALLSDDQRAAGIVVMLDPDARDARSTGEVLDAVEAALRARPAPGGYRTRLSGLPVLRADIVRNLRRDLLSLIPLAGVVFLAVMGVLFRRVSGTLVPMAAVAMGLSWLVIPFVLTGQSLNIISNILPVLLFVVGMANCVHVVHRYAEEVQRTPNDRLGAARRTIAHMAPACLLTFATTAIGFGTLVAARSAAVQAVGWHAVLGLALLYVSTIAVLGPLLPSFRPSRHHGEEHTLADPITRIVAAAGHAVARHPWLTVAGSAAVVAAAVVAASSVVINSAMIETYEEDHPTTRTLRFVENRLGGLLPLDVSLRATKPGAMLDAEVYRKVARIEQFGRRQPEVLFVRSYVDLNQEVHAALTDGLAARDALPTLNARGRRLIATSHALLLASGEAANYRAFITPDARRARVMLRVRDAGTRRLLVTIDALEKQLGELFPANGPIEARLTGEAYVHARGMDAFVRDFFRSLVGAALIIFVVIGLLFRSVRLGIISVLPNLTPLVLTMGYMGLRGYDLNAANVIVFAISIGIAVDSTIHFLARFREEVRRDEGVLEAVRRAYLGAGRAIVITTVVTVVGLSVLLVSEFVPSRRFAELATVTMIGALVGDLLLLPACVVLFWKRDRRRPVTAPGACTTAAARD